MKKAKPKKAKIKKQTVEANLGKEVSLLANQVMDALKSSATSREVKTIGREAVGSFRATGDRLVNALKKAHGSETAQDIKNQARRVLDIGKQETGNAHKNLRRNLAKGLLKIGQELQNLGDNLRKK